MQKNWTYVLHVFLNQNKNQSLLNKIYQNETSALRNGVETDAKLQEPLEFKYTHKNTFLVLVDHVHVVCVKEKKWYNSFFGSRSYQKSNYYFPETCKDHVKKKYTSQQNHPKKILSNIETI